MALTPPECGARCPALKRRGRPTYVCVDQAILASAQREEAELEATIDSARKALEADVKALTDDLVAKALGRSA